MSQLWRERSIALVVIAALAGVASWTFTHLNVTTEITHFLPEAEDRELARIAREMSSSDLNRSITLLIGAEDEATTLAACADLAERLEALDSVEWVRRGPGDDMNQAFYELYFERRLLFFSDRPDEVELDDEALRGAARELKQRLLGMTGSFVRQVAPRDPLLSFPHHLERLRETQQGTLRVVDGQLLTEDGRGVVFLASRGSPFDSNANRPLAEGLASALEAVGEAHGPLEVQESGVHRFAIASEAAIKTDVTRISVVSSIGVVVLFLLLFRSPRYLLLSTIPLGAGFVCGLTASQLMFGRIHGLSLAFGATLIGVAIDYVAHAVNHHTLVPARGGAKESVREIWPGLALGATTTIAGLAGLAWTDFPGIRELAVLTSVGVFVALLSTRYLLPPFMPAAPAPTDWHRALTDRLGVWLKSLRSSRVALLVLPVLSVLV
ncbi:MAG: MMPL family transporter, partial [Sandaracinaceae bacterium]